MAQNGRNGGKKNMIHKKPCSHFTLPQQYKMIPVGFNGQNSCNLKIFLLTALYDYLQSAGRRTAARVMQALEKKSAFLQEYLLCWSTWLQLPFNFILVW